MRIIFRPLILTLLLLTAWAPTSSHGEVHAIIVHGLVGDGAIEQDWKTQEQAWVSAMAVRRAQPKNMLVIQTQGPDDRTVRDQLMAALAGWKSELQKGDEAYLILLGQGVTRNGRYRFDVRGPRITGNDLVGVMEGMPEADLWVVTPGPGGRGLIDLLGESGVNFISATDHERQINHPRFGGILAEQIEANPKADLVELAAKANSYVASYYKERKLIRTETAGVWVAGERIDLDQHAQSQEEAESELETAAAVSTEFDTTKLPGDLVAPGPDEPYEIRAQTPEEAKRLHDANAAPRSANAMAVVLQRDIVMDLKSDGSALWNESAAMILHDLRVRGLIDAVWTSKCSSTGCSPVRLKALRVIRPDGYTLEWDYQAPPPMLLPGLLAGTLVEYDFETVSNKPLLPFYTGQIDFALPHADVLQQTVQLLSPPSYPIQNKLTVTQGREIQETQEMGLAYIGHKWTVSNVPPKDDPRDSPRVLLSGFGTWDEMADFYRGMMRDTVGDAEAVANAAQAWTQDASTRVEKIAALYEQVNAFRYNTIPLGVRGLRPEPASEVIQSRYGDCKAKANLLVEMLATLDIEAHFVLVERGGDQTPLDPEFPVWKFNHAVVVVPDPHGTGEGPPLWLDATDEIAPIGMMPPGDPGQSALVLAEEPYLTTIPAFYEGKLASSGGEVLLSDSSCELDLVAGPDGLTGTAVWRLQGWMAYRWHRVLKGGDDFFSERFETACLAAWPTVKVSHVTPVNSELGSPLVVTAKLHFPHAVSAFSRELRLLATPGPWATDLLPTAQHHTPNGGYPGSFVQRLVLAHPESWDLKTTTPMSFDSATSQPEPAEYTFTSDLVQSAGTSSAAPSVIRETAVHYRSVPDFSDNPTPAEHARAWRAHLDVPLIFEQTTPVN
ncbi:MAG: transglutaminase domain-containing protein [Planctomycetota bacterium]